MFEFDTSFDYNNNDQTYSTTCTAGFGGPGRNDCKKQNDNWDKGDFRYIAHSTLQILDYEEYFPPGRDGPYDLRAKNSVDG